MTLTPRQRRWLKATAHPRKSVVTVGQHGLSEAVLAELETALAHHELLKVKVAAGDRELRDSMIAEMTAATGAELVDRIGNVAVLYRHNPKKHSPMAVPADPA